MSPDLAALGLFGDAVSFVFVQRESQTGGTRIGGLDQIGSFTWTHLQLTFAAMAVAILVALPLGVWLGHRRRGGFLAISVSNVGRAVPSLALIAVLIAFVGAGFVNVGIALALLAIPPILTNAYTAVAQVDADVVDAARGQGLTEGRIMREIELPLALPLIFGGIRISMVNVLATATIAPLAGVLTLGDPILNASVYGPAGQLGGALCVAVLAIITELVLGALQRAVTPRGLRLAERRAGRSRLIRPLARRTS